MDAWKSFRCAELAVGAPDKPDAMNRGNVVAGDERTVSGLSDAEVFARVARGDVDAFALFYDRHASLFYSIAWRILGSVHDAEEALQEATVRIWESAPAYDTALGNMVSWAVTITRNKAIDRLRAGQRKHRLIAEIIESSGTDGGAADDATGQRHAVMNETGAIMRAALGDLPVEQRQALELAFFAGLTQAEIADRCGQPLGTVKARIRRGMLALREVLEDQL